MSEQRASTGEQRGSKWTKRVSAREQSGETLVSVLHWVRGNYSSARKKNPTSPPPTNRRKTKKPTKKKVKRKRKIETKQTVLDRTPFPFLIVRKIQVSDRIFAQPETSDGKTQPPPGFEQSISGIRVHVPPTPHSPPPLFPEPIKWLHS